MKNNRRMSKGELSMRGIMGIVISVLFLAMTMPMQVEYINILYNAYNETSYHLLVVAILPFEIIMLLLGIVYAGENFRQAYSGYQGGGSY